MELVSYLSHWFWEKDFFGNGDNLLGYIQEALGHMLFKLHASTLKS